MSSNVVMTSADVASAPLPRARARVSWGAIFAGLFVTLGTWILFSALGLAIGLSSVDPTHPESLRGGGLFSGIWSYVVMVIALFLGGLVAARSASIVTRPMGAIHGIVLWALATIATVVLSGYVLRGIATAAVGLSVEPTSALASATEDSGARGELREDPTPNAPPGVVTGRDLQRSMAQAADSTGKAMWWVFFGMLIGLGATVLGSFVGVSRRQRVLAKRILRGEVAAPEVVEAVPPPQVVEPLPQT